MGKIDFRVRPPYKTYLSTFFEGKDGGVGGQAGLKDCREKFLGVSEGGSIETKSDEDLQEELQRAGVDLIVVPGRGGYNVPNEEVLEYADKYPGKVIAFPFIDPIDGQKALDDIDKYVINGKGQGVALEPGISLTSLHWSHSAILHCRCWIPICLASWIMWQKNIRSLSSL